MTPGQGQELPCSRLKLSGCRKRRTAGRPYTTRLKFLILQYFHPPPRSETRQGREAMAKLPPAPQNLRGVIFRVCVFCPPSSQQPEGRPAAYGQGSCLGAAGVGTAAFRTEQPIQTVFQALYLISTVRAGAHQGTGQSICTTPQKSPAETSSSHSNLPHYQAGQREQHLKTLTQHHFNSQGREGAQSSLWSCAAETACVVSPSGSCLSYSLPTSWQRGQRSEKAPQQLQD